MSAPRTIRRRLFVENGSSGNAGQWEWDQRVVKLGRPSSLKSMLNKSLVTYIERWQSISNFDATGKAAHYLNQLYNNVASVNVFNCPMFAYDLSSMLFGSLSSDDASVANEQVQTIPFFRLTRDGNANYNWQQWIGYNAGPGGGSATSYFGDIEKCDTAGANKFPNAQKFYHDWSDIRLVLRGAIQRPCRIHVKIVKFKEFDYAPVRQYANSSGGGITYHDGAVDPLLTTRINNFWDAYFGTKESNPIRSIYNDSNESLYDVVHHQFYDFAPQNTTDADAIADQKVCKIFFDVKKKFQTIRGLDDARQSNVVNTNSNVGLSYKAEVFRTGVREASPFIEKKEQGYWLIVSADMFTKATATVDGTEGDPNFSPSFDICVRSKKVLNALECIAGV